MNENLKFKKGLFGYTKKSVNMYLEAMNEKYFNSLEDKDEVIDELKKQLEEIKKSVNESDLKLQEATEKNAFVGEAILSAKEKADEIITVALKEAEMKKKEVELEIKEASMVLKKMNEEIRQMKESVNRSVEKYRTELDSIIKFTDRD